MKTLPSREAQQPLASYLPALAAEPLVITAGGKPVAALIAISDDAMVDQITATLRPHLRDILEANARQIARNGGIAHDEFWARLNAEYDDTDAPARPA